MSSSLSKTFFNEIRVKTILSELEILENETFPDHIIEIILEYLKGSKNENIPKTVSDFFLCVGFQWYKFDIITKRYRDKIRLENDDTEAWVIFPGLFLTSSSQSCDFFCFLEGCSSYGAVAVAPGCVAPGLLINNIKSGIFVVNSFFFCVILCVLEFLSLYTSVKKSLGSSKFKLVNLTNSPKSSEKFFLK